MVAPRCVSDPGGVAERGRGVRARAREEADSSGQDARKLDIRGASRVRVSI
jgi:hypothetical protein